MDVLWSISGAIGNDREGEIGMRRLVDERKGSSEAEDFQEGKKGGKGLAKEAGRLDCFPRLLPVPLSIYTIELLLRCNDGYEWTATMRSTVRGWKRARGFGPERNPFFLGISSPVLEKSVGYGKN